ncbi:hypothetical protein CEXT_681591 [Caerostris extrusa]|uniref:Secreted protein n=1 Tax=Caerostris extrusa TaxID=172846 RepID=A0AAV4NKX0_CAEEX|nr:hypothetical protein CEXT_681591 [Caerostris extrusa]
MPFFCTWRAAFLQWCFAFLVISHSFLEEALFPSSGSLVWLSNVWRCFLVLHLINLRVLVAFERHVHSTMRVFQLFRCLPNFFAFHIKIDTFDFLSHSKLLSHSPRACSSLPSTSIRCDSFKHFSSNGNRKSMLSSHHFR